MWVRTQDNKQMLKVNSFSITRNYGGKLKFALVSTTAISGFFSSQSSTILGLYTTESDAIQELDRIQNHLYGSHEGVYQVS